MRGRIAIGVFLLGAAAVAFVVGHVWVLVLDTSIVYRVGGFWAAVAAWCVPPVLYCAPFYAGFLWNDWRAATVLLGTYLVPGFLFTNGVLMLWRAPHGSGPGQVRVILGRHRAL